VVARPFSARFGRAWHRRWRGSDDGCGTPAGSSRDKLADEDDGGQADRDESDRDRFPAAEDHRAAARDRQEAGKEREAEEHDPEK
jgi:hypothetical protein